MYALPRQENIQPGFADGKDAYVSEASPGYKAGNVAYLYVAGSDTSDDFRAYLLFDVSGLPPTAVVTSAQLGLYHTDSSHSAISGPVGAFLVPGSWSESDITWNEQPYSGGILVDTQDVPASVMNDFIYWNIDSLVQGWIDGSINNHGVMLKDTVESTSEGHKSFYSSDAGNPDKRPKLIIEYYEP